MIIYKEGNLFNSDCQTLVNTVNCVGVMGKGIALEFKKRYPKMYLTYKSLCSKNLLKIGTLQLYKKEEQWILNFPTKLDWRDPSKLEYIKLGLEKFVETYKEKGITSIAFPKLGCNNGGLSWEKDVKPLMEEYLGNLEDIYIEIYI